MLVVAATGLLIIALATLIHYECLRLLNAWLPRFRIPNRTRLLVAVFSAFASHAVEILVYGVAVWLIARQQVFGALSGHAGSVPLETCLYYSAETYTSLGFGDVVPTGSLRLLAGIEALHGLLLIGWSASFLYLAMERFWTLPDVAR